MSVAKTKPGAVKKLARAEDFQFTWVTRELGPQWETWRSLAAGWLTARSGATSDRIFGLRAFIEGYLHKQQMSPEPSWFLERSTSGPDFYTTACPDSFKGGIYTRYINEFLDWVLQQHFSEPDEHGRLTVRPIYHNPIAIRMYSGVQRQTESVRTPLPYRYIREMKEVLAPGPNLRDWTWAHEACTGDWFDVDPLLIDESDPDCVWRIAKVRQTGQIVKSTQLWSPARACGLLLKLTLPIRTFQVSMLDSGEADTWRYKGSGWIESRSALAEGTRRKPVQRGVFRRTEDHETGELRTALYINTNKTGDIGKEGEALGYVIPWQHDELLRWLEKLRNWQAKYNPVERTTRWTELEGKHLGNAKTAAELVRYPQACFLFRHAAGEGADRAKPMSKGAIETLWITLLNELEKRCADRGETLADGAALRFGSGQKEWRRPAFPLHSLRVSLLTCFALDAEVPLVVLSKLVAGHSRLIMTLYYTKPGVVRMTETLNAASEQLDRTAAAGLQRFLLEASYEKLQERAICNDVESVLFKIRLDTKDRNPAGWMPRHHGLCLVGGNTSPTEVNSSAGGCYNGGELIQHHTYTVSSVNMPVPGGPGNCVRCRWFVTEPHYLDSLRSHFNNVSYRTAEAARRAKEHEDALEVLKLQRVTAEREKRPFDKLQDYIRAERLWESAISEVDQLANDLLATLRLIRRCMALLERDQAGSPGQQLVAVGSLQDVQLAMEETDSELLQLFGVCDDAEVYPDNSPGEAIIRRSQILDSALYRDGVPPVFMALNRSDQLKIGNRFVQRLALLANPVDPALGLRKLVEVVESGASLAELGVQDVAELLKASMPGASVTLHALTRATARLEHLA